MRPNLRPLLSLSSRVGIAIVGIVAAVVVCDARDTSAAPTDIGLPTAFVNRPVCGTGEVLDEWRFCTGMKQPHSLTE